jgi:mRNA interferase HicA
LPGIETNRQKIIARLERDGWKLLRHGSQHGIFSKQGRPPVVVPRHRTLSPGVARTIAKAAEWI